MRYATENDRERIIEILSTAFEKNQSVAEICLKDDRRVRSLMDYAFNICMAYGKAWITEDHNACALVLLPDRKGFSFRSLLWDIRLAYGVIGLGNVSKIMAKEAKIKKHHPKTPFYYLWFIGVHPVQKGMGIGSELMAQLMADAKSMDRPLYLETSTISNLPWYRKFGLEVYDELHLSYTLFFLRKENP